MLVMLSIGQNTNAIIERVSKQIDNVDFHYLSNVYEFINQSKLRRFAFDRLVFSSKFISSEEDMSKLCDFIRQELDSVEIVYILNNESKELDDIFKKYFDSPMYTVMFDNNPTIKSIRDSIKLPIPELKAIYYTKEDGDLKEGKKSFSGMFRGGKKNNQKNEKVKSEESKSPKNTAQSSENNSWDFEFGNISNSGENTSSSSENGILSNSNDSIISENSNEGSVVVNSNLNQQGEISEVSTDDFDLTIGEYGSQHSDSGFLNESDIEELNSLANKKEDSVDEVVFAGSSENINVNNVNESRDIDNRSTYSEDISSSNNTYNSLFVSGKLNMVIGLSGSGGTAFVVDSAVSEVDNGKKVLIIDFDFISNGILSFIDIEKFYKNKRSEGINSNKMYSEDGIDILSKGYGYNDKISSSVLIDFLSSYDLVIVDCPIDCLSSISDDIFVKSNVIICSISDISKLIELSLTLADRKKVSLKKEVKICRECRIANNCIDKDDIEYVKEKVLFPNGCWLDNM